MENNSNNIYATVQPKETTVEQEKTVGYDSNNQAYNNNAYGTPNQAYGAPNQAYGAPNQTYGAPNQAYNTSYGANQTYNGGYNTAAPTYSKANTNVVRCPGKEISGLVCGIMSIFYGAFGVLFCWHPAIAFSFGIIAIGNGIPAIILNKQVKKIATLMTKKTTIGKNLGVAGIICGAVAMVLDIIVILVLVGLYGTLLYESLLYSY